MPSNISAHEYSLSRIFSDEFRYKVPNYQRPYAWEWEHARQLFEDVRDADRWVSPGVVADDCFLWCIVVVKSDDKPEFELVDGQQRLTTLTMLFCALRDAEHCDDPDGAKKINQYVWQQGDWTQRTEDVVRLSLRERDDWFFFDNMYSGKEPFLMTRELMWTRLRLRREFVRMPPGCSMRSRLLPP